LLVLHWIMYCITVVILMIKGSLYIVMTRMTNTTFRLLHFQMPQFVCKIQLMGWVIINGDGGCSFLAAYRLKSISLVQRLATIWCYSAFIAWTGWTLAMTESWWQHHKHCSGTIIYNYYNQDKDSQKNCILVYTLINTQLQVFLQIIKIYEKN